MPRPALVLPALAVAAALVTAGAAFGTADAATPKDRAAITFDSTSAHHVVAPASARPGVVHLRVKKQDDEVLVVEALHPGRASKRQVAAGLNGQSPQALLKNYRFVAAVASGPGVYTSLPKGSYYLADALVETFKAGDIRTWTVRGARTDAQVPASHPAQVTSRNVLGVPSTLPSTGWLKLRNDSSSLGDIVLTAVSPKATAAQLKALVAHPTEKKLAAVQDADAGEAAFVVSGPGTTSWFHYSGAAQRYVAVLDAYTGPDPTLHHGQVVVTTLTQP